MFIQILYEDGEQLLLNPNCAARNFMDYVREKCGFDPDVSLDFCDENGNFANVSEKGVMDSVSSCFTARGTYIPLQVERDASKKMTKLSPLLKGWEKAYPSLDQKLKLLVTGSPDRNRKRSPVIEKFLKRKEKENKLNVKADKDNSGSNVDMSMKKSVSRMGGKGRNRKRATD